MAATVQTGTVTIAADAASGTDTITAVDLADAFVVGTYSTDENTPNMGLVTTQLTATTTVTCQRAGDTGGGEIVVRYYVVEDTDQVVQRDSTEMSSTSIDETINAVTLANAFVIASVRHSGSGYDDDDWVRCELTATTTLNLQIPDTGSTVCEWQVVENSNLTVQRGDLSFGTGDASKATPTLTAFDTAKTVPMFTMTTDNGATTNMGQAMVRADLTSSTVVTFTRAVTGQTMELHYEIVEYTDDTAVYPTTVNFGTGSTSEDDSFTASTLANTYVLAPGWQNCGGTVDYSTDDVPGIASASLELTSTTNLQSVRALSDSTAAVLSCYVVDTGASAAGGIIPQAYHHYHHNLRH